MLLGSARVKTAHKMLMKLSPVERSLLDQWEGPGWADLTDLECSKDEQARIA